jgi:predicted AlkP superfamily pyrophosphatase or phosphodiesterase
MRAPALLTALGWTACARSATAPAPPPSPAAPTPAVIVVSIDGLRPADALTGDDMPALQALAARGAWADDVRSVFPSMTYPAHASMVTGVEPAVHGVVSNLVDAADGDPHRAWRWAAADLRAPTLWDVARQAGKRVALVAWPATDGAIADVVVPDVWSVRGPDHAARVRARATPGFVEAALAADPDLAASWRPPKDDRGTVALAQRALRVASPELLLVHLIEVDHHSHRDGPDSATARTARRQADAALVTLQETQRALGRLEATTWIVVSDHGMAPVDRRVRLGPAMVTAGLVEVDGRGAVQRWRVSLVTDGGGAAFAIPRDAADREGCARAAEALTAAARRLGGLEVLGPDAIRARGGDPRACAAVLAAPGTFLAGDLVGAEVDAPDLRGAHGFAPDDPSMWAVLVLAGPGVTHEQRHGLTVRDVAPMAAAALGIAWPPAR